MAEVQPQPKSEVAVQDVESVDKVAHPQHDRFGATAKIDLREITLVRKIDWHMMV